MEKKALISQLPHDINQIMAVINRDVPEYYEWLQGYKVPRNIIDWLFISLITYVLNNAANYTGTIKQRTDRLFEGLHQEAALLLNTLKGYNVPDNLIDIIFPDLIEISLREISGASQGPATGPAWSDWEDLGGHLASAPAVSSWGIDRLDVFGKSKDGSLLHKWWDGMEWSEWEDLGGNLASAPGAVSWGPDRIDVFAVGQNQALWHLWWNGSVWSEWEDLGGILISAPAAVSRGPNLIDVFTRGESGSLWYKGWDGSHWSVWIDTGDGSINSGPAAASTGTYRLELFALGDRNQLLFRTWHGGRWSNWHSLGGEIISEPAAVSWGICVLTYLHKGRIIISGIYIGNKNPEVIKAPHV